MSQAMLDAAAHAARTAGQLLKARPSQVQHKGAIDLVTEVDLASEACIRAALASTGVPVLGEEGGGANRGTRWVVDPLDGTTNFVHGYPFYCVSIALVEGDVVVVGAIYDPIRDHLYAARRGAGATREGVRLAVSGTTVLDHALGSTGFPYSRRERMPELMPYFQRALMNTQGVRRGGSAAMDLALLASGASDYSWEFGLAPWDTAAGSLVVEEAGGRVTRLDGSAWTLDAPVILATNAHLHDQVVAMMG
jgi:myo-inositol-1(or 4)-monophosphatase